MADFVAEARATTGKINEKITSFQGKVNGALASVPDWLSWIVDKIKEGWNWLCEKMSEFWDLVEELFARAGDSGTLYDYASSWSSSVGTPVGQCEYALTEGQLLTDDTWTGEGASAYVQALPEQRATIQAVAKTVAPGVSEGLTSMANAIDDFWSQIGITFATYLAALAAAVAAAAGVVTIPVSIAAIITAAVAAIGSILNADRKISREGTTLATKFRTISSGIRPSWPTFAVPA